MMNKHEQAIRYLTEHRKDLLKYIKLKGLTHHDAEDLLTEATADVLNYYNIDRVKSVHLAIGRQLDLYYKGYGTVRNMEPESEVDPCTEKLELEDIREENGCNPEDIVMIEEAKNLYPDLIDSFTEKPEYQEFLTLVFVDGIDKILAGDIADLPRRTASHVYKSFMESV